MVLATNLHASGRVGYGPSAGLHRLYFSSIPDGTEQVRTFQVRTAQVGTAQVGTAQVGTFQVRTFQVRTFQVRTY